MMCERETEERGTLPQSSVTLNLNHIQGVEVGDEQVGLSVGWKTKHGQRHFKAAEQFIK